MKGFIFVDLEGATGVDERNPRVIQCNTSEWEQVGRDCITQDVYAVVSSLSENGVKEVVICDVHGPGNSIRRERFIFPDLICSFTTVADLSGLEKADFGMLLGFHPKKQAEGVFPHSFRMDLERVMLNGQEIGEIELYAVIFAERGIPTLLVSGDVHAVEEALQCIPDLIGVTVKSRSGREFWHLSRVEANELLKVKTREALTKRENVLLMDKQCAGVELFFEFANPDYQSGLVILQSKGLRVGDGGYTVQGSTYVDAFQIFLETLPALDREQEKHMMLNRQFMARLQRDFPTFTERREEIIAKARELGFEKRMIYFSAEEREQFYAMVRGIVC